jgi:hypothetical protein
MKVLFTFIAIFAIAVTVNAHTVVPNDPYRKILSDKHYPTSVFEHPKYFKGVIEKYHLKLKTAGEAGCSHIPGYDGFGNYALLSELEDQRPVWVDENNRPWYLGGCLNLWDVKPPEQVAPKVIHDTKVVHDTQVIHDIQVVHDVQYVRERPCGHWECRPVFGCVRRCVRDFCGRPHMHMARVVVSQRRIWVPDQQFHAPVQPFPPYQPFQSARADGPRAHGQADGDTDEFREIQRELLAKD